MEKVKMTYQELLAQGKQTLKDAGIADAETDSFLLMEYVTGMNRGNYFLNRDKQALAEEAVRYRELVKKRQQHIPLQHITGEQEFMGFPFLVNENVLVPRQDTECLVEAALPFVSGKRVLDMCTGSGCIAVSIALLGNVLCCHGVDVSKEALAVAEKNAERNRACVTFQQSDLFENVTGCYDVIVSNPPYIPPEIIRGLDKEVREHEPMLALDGGEDGLVFYRKITKECRRYLSKDGYLFYEIGCEQAEDVMEIMRSYGFADVVCQKDYAGNDRIVYGKLSVS